MSTIREDFEAHWTSAHGRSPLTWAVLFDSSLQHKGQMPEDLNGVYFAKDAQKAWDAYQAADKAATERAAKLCEALRDAHCRGTRSAPTTADWCQPDDVACEFVVAWNDAAAAIRAQTGGDQT